jgi:hypothetical protein
VSIPRPAVVPPLALHTTAAQHAPQSHAGTITLDGQGHDDPKTLDSYDNFLVALRRPR